MTDHKIVHDSVHGSIRVEGVSQSLLEVPELQRLHSIHQLGLAYLVYPGANHTRFEHSIGTFSVASRICSSLGIQREEALLVQCAALLHDVGHLPYSHTLEFVLHDRFKIDHAEISRRLIRGEDTVLNDSDRRILGKYSTIPETLERHDIDPKDVSRLLEGGSPGPLPQKTLAREKDQAHFNSKRYLSQIVSGPVDADQLDYLKRDAHYTGVAYGVIDLDRLFQTMQVFNGDLVVDRGGLSAVEGMLVARALMFSSVYFHKTVRISELMLAKAVEQLGRNEIDTIHSMTDYSLLAYMVSKGGYFEEMATLIKYRKLFKKAYAVRTSEVDEDGWRRVGELGIVGKRRVIEEDIARRAGVDPGSVIIDVPSSELEVSEPRISLTDVRILDDGHVKMLPRISSIAASLQIRKVHEWALMVACPAKEKDKVAKAAAKILGP
ncbi:MAG: HD domain-containing protein [Thermoplasmatota archaeon]|nr:HD domain-containing protein [Candidatus Thermoplasmatota archaeon]MBU1915044.1 HD domain-containing protein [Candidatus Thermoplasmatota archaeon]